MLKRSPQNLQRLAGMKQKDETTPLFGILVSAPANDPFTDLVGKDWSTTHWFSTQQERDRAIKDMQREHEYSRRGDKPTLIFAAIGRGANT